MFKRINKSVCSAVFVMGMFATPASAILIEADLVSGSGDGFITRDTDTGLEWLDLTLTLGQSYNNVAGGFGGFTGMGFSFAKQSQVVELVSSAGLDVIGPGSFFYFNSVKTLMDLVGCAVGCASQQRYSFGISDYDSITSLMTIMTWDVREVDDGSDSSSNNAGAVYFLDGGYSKIGNSPNLGSFLIRESIVSAVPVPAALPMFGTGLAFLGFVGWYRKRKVG